VRWSPGGFRQITVANPTPGAGKTVATLVLGLTFGRIRGGLLLAWDNTEATGTLGSRASPGDGLDVFACEEAATGGQALAARTFRDTREALARRYGLILVDTGNDIHAPNWQAAVDATDQFVITVRTGDDSVDSAVRLLDRLDGAGRSELVRRAVVVVTMPPPPANSRPGAVERFEPRCRAVLPVPYDRHVDSDAPVRYDALSPESRRAWLGVAAAAADGL
jgi:MinD-like ATPase involved in chromosome partitioning or flagellar assembly